MRRIAIDERILSMFPKFWIGVVIAENCENKKDSSEINMLINEVVEQTKSVFNLDELAKHPLIENWRKAYRKFGEKKDRASHESLIRRILRDKGFPRINLLVDIYNYISIKYKCPVGGEDCDKISWPLVLTIANGDERFVPLGEDRVENPYKGEVIWKDAEKVVCRKWNYRESDETKITEGTKNAVFVVEALPPLNERVVESACNELCKLIEKYANGKATFSILSHERLEVSF